MNGQTLSLRRRVYNRGMRALVWLCAGLTCALLVFLIGYIFCRGIPGLTWELLSGQTSYIKNTIGILPNILNTLYIIGHRSALGRGGCHLSDGVRGKPAAGEPH